MSQTVLITGALSGIGRETAIAFAQEGYNVAVSGRRQEAGEEFATELRRLGAAAEFVLADVSIDEGVRKMVDMVVHRFGSIDIAINNAGTEGKPGPIVEQTRESITSVFETNVVGVLLSLKYELKAMMEQKRGSIINISSTMGRTSFPNQGVYAASKHAVEALTKTAALEGAPFGIRVNTVAPGPTDTNMLHRLTGGADGIAKMTAGIPLGRAGTPREVADACVFIASDKASFITGQVLGVNGGRLLG
ncbi:glucose 1-dehydrogenase [Rhizobium calliandrae]|uniref:Glucose 1-dehydrogenase n=2 Tax=Rhizobium TaxID=379 RepID=A0A387FM60_9HYPH|nr:MULTISPECIES: glucose 1-dehydrogenase [Rhizobium]AYG59958.1 glucose 1-dehydrogenase [Rhizobium jaguaris]MDL2406928.1 glucose 1-dehydrogenase [Rhizobium calliandrae]